MPKQKKYDPYGLSSIVKTIVGSALPEHKKIVYLYLIATGDISLHILENIEKDLEEISNKAKADLNAKKAEIEDLKTQISALDRELDKFAVESCFEAKRNVEAFLEHVTTAEEVKREQEKKQKVKNIKQKIS